MTKHLLLSFPPAPPLPCPLLSSRPRSHPPSRRFRSVEASCPATDGTLPLPCSRYGWFRMVPSAGARIHYEFRSESYSQPPSTSNPSERDPSPAHSAGRSDPQTSKTPLLSFPPAPALIPRPAAFAVLRHRAQQLTGRSLFRVLGTGWWFRMVLSAGARIHFGSRSGSHWPPSTSNPPECDPSLPMPTLFGDPTRRLPSSRPALSAPVPPLSQC
jgi:hypothetical protein